MVQINRLSLIAGCLRLIVFALICVPLIAAAITYPSNRRTLDRQIDASTKYLATEGRVLKSEVVETRYHTVVVDYEYEVDGQTHRSNRYAYTHAMRAFLPWEEALRSYAVGNTIRVYYDPNEPTQSVLNPAPPNYSGMVTGLGFALFSLIAGLCVMASEEFENEITKTVQRIAKNLEERGAAPLPPPKERLFTPRHEIVKMNKRF